MATVTLTIPNEVKEELKQFSWVNLSEVVRQSILLFLLEKSKSPEEQELVRWSVELGRKAKKGRFKRLLAELAPEERKELLNSMSPEKRKEYE